MPATDVIRNAQNIGFHLKHYTNSFLSPPIKLGVTGLSRSGKTVFITAFVHSLLHQSRLPFFQVKVQGRFLRAYLEPQPNDTVPRFSYEQHLELLTQNTPEWPESTSRISQLRLTIEYQPTRFMKRQLGYAKRHIDLIDYPGEWLLDLPLLSQSYEQWSAYMIDLARRPERTKISEEWLGLLSEHTPQSGQNEPVAEKLTRAFKAYLFVCRHKDFALSLTPPGRFLMPGDLADSPALTFCPMILPKGEKPARHSLWSMMARRFDAYKTYVVKPFFRDHFITLDRQIVLVDLLSALNSGHSAVVDMQQALEDILKCFKTGKKTWLSSLWRRPIDRIIFAATKADHIHHSSHDKLETIVAKLTEDAIDRAQFSSAEVKTLALASLRATREAEVAQNGEVLPCILGLPMAGQNVRRQSLDQEKEVAIFPGDLPSDLEETMKKLSSHGHLLNFISFRPPVLTSSDLSTQPMLPHIRLDRAIEFLIGDKLL